MKRIKLPISKEEKIAHKIGSLISDFTLDLDMVGFYIARSQPHVIMSRAIEILDAAEYNKNQIQIERQHERLF